jgi:hypothetical protein
MQLIKVLRECDGHDPYAYVLSANIHRRHLTAEQKNELIGKLLKARPEMSDRHIAAIAKRDHKTVGKKRTEMKSRGEIPHVEKRTDTKGRKQPSTKKSVKKAKAEEAFDDLVDFVFGEATTSLPPESRPRSVSARDIALKDFSARAMELVRLTRNKSAECFAKTALSDENIRHLAKFFADLINIRNEKVVDRICGSAEASTEQRTAEHADGAAS